MCAYSGIKVLLLSEVAKWRVYFLLLIDNQMLHRRFVTFSSCAFPKEENTKSIRDPERLGLLKMYFLSCFWKPTNCVLIHLCTSLVNVKCDSFMDLLLEVQHKKILFFKYQKNQDIYISSLQSLGHVRLFVTP